MQLKVQLPWPRAKLGERESGHIRAAFCGCVGTSDRKGLVYTGWVSGKQVGELRVIVAQNEKLAHPKITSLLVHDMRGAGVEARGRREKK